jgi:hypothetical protein
MEILSPVWPDTPAPPGTARRPTALAGAALALVDDNLDQPFTERLEALLVAAGARVRRFVKPSGTAPSPAALLDEAARGADAAVVGVGL